MRHAALRNNFKGQYIAAFKRHTDERFEETEEDDARKEFKLYKYERDLPSMIFTDKCLMTVTDIGAELKGT